MKMPGEIRGTPNRIWDLHLVLFGCRVWGSRIQVDLNLCLHIDGCSGVVVTIASGSEPGMS